MSHEGLENPGSAYVIYNFTFFHALGAPRCRHEHEKHVLDDLLALLMLLRLDVKFSKTACSDIAASFTSKHSVASVAKDNKKSLLNASNSSGKFCTRLSTIQSQYVESPGRTMSPGTKR